MTAGLGTIVDVGAILVGYLVGMLLKGGSPKRLQDTISNAMGLHVVFVGVAGTIQGSMTMSGDSFGTWDTLVIVVYMVAGATFGEWINTGYKLERLGEWHRSRIPDGQKSGTFTEASVSNSLSFCMGTMAITGPLEDGLNHNYSTLFTKAVMNEVLSIVFMAVLGIGTASSTFPVDIYQGSMTALAGLVKPYLTGPMIVRMSRTGSILIFGLGLNLVLGSKVKIRNPLPAVFLSLLVCLLGL